MSEQFRPVLRVTGATNLFLAAIVGALLLIGPSADSDIALCGAIAALNFIIGIWLVAWPPR